MWSFCLYDATFIFVGLLLFVHEYIQISFKYGKRIPFYVILVWLMVYDFIYGHITYMFNLINITKIIPLVLRTFRLEFVIEWFYPKTHVHVNIPFSQNIAKNIATSFNVTLVQHHDHQSLEYDIEFSQILIWIFIFYIQWCLLSLIFNIIKLDKIASIIYNHKNEFSYSCIASFLSISNDNRNQTILTLKFIIFVLYHTFIFHTIYKFNIYNPYQYNFYLVLYLIHYFIMTRILLEVSTLKESIFSNCIPNSLINGLANCFYSQIIRFKSAPDVNVNLYSLILNPLFIFEYTPGMANTISYLQDYNQEIVNYYNSKTRNSSKRK
jgi:hypothetical protein